MLPLGDVMSGDEIKLAASFIRDGQHEAARRLLVPYVKANSRDARGWLLLSFVLEDPSQQIESVRHALRLKPDDERAQLRLATLLGKQKADQSPEHARPRDKTSPFREREDESLGDPRQSLSRTPSEPHTPEWAKSIPAIQSGADVSEISLDSRQPVTPAGSKLIPSKTNNLRAFIVAGVAILCFISVVAGVIGYPAIRDLNDSVQRTQSAKRIEQVAAQIGTAQPTLPASWTPTPEPTITLTPTITPTITQTPPPTLIGPNEQELEEMQVIQTEVADLRGLNVVMDVQGYILDKGRVRPILEDLYYSSGGTEEEVADQKRQLIALGLVKPTYNLFDNILNNIADGIGGFFDPEAKEIFVLGFLFGGVEHYIYAHEFDHALVDQHFPLDAYGNYPVCLSNEDQCKAIDALIEGDASLLMDQWWDQYASVQDYQDILRYNPPWNTLPEQFPPPYASRDALFPYYEGRLFVEYLYDRGNWAEVNGAYQAPPESTEHILHPQKYIAGESPITVRPADIAPTLGQGWRELTTDTLGEWSTYLVLGYGADHEAQVDDFTADRASAGWGGDTYQIYYNDALDQTVMSIRWIWDTNSDATQFFNAMLEYQDARFRGAKLSRTDGQCWEANNQASCIFRSEREILWLLAPNQTILNNLLASVPGFP